MKMSEQINELATALVVAQGLIQNPTKSVSNAFFKSKYADLAGVIDVVRPAFTQAGIAVIQSPSTGDNGEIGVTTTLVHTSGQWMADQVSMAIDPSAKNPAQAAGSLITYLRRYSLSAFANVAQEDDDGNSLAGNVKAVEQKPVEQKDDLAEYQTVCSENNSSIIAIKAGIANGDLSLASEAWFELENEIKVALWRAPSKGGCFTTIERDVIKSTEFREANLGAEA
tara:strand:+ start:50 stop:727 length:678 start_codon:yes stop_codon:yes gene_type:complete